MLGGQSSGHCLKCERSNPCPLPVCWVHKLRSVLEEERERRVWTMSVSLFRTLLVLWHTCTHCLACGLSNDVSVRSWVLKDCLLICTVHLASQQAFLASYFSECIEYKVACMIQVLLTSELLHTYTPSHTLLSFYDTCTLKIQQCKRKTCGFCTFSWTLHLGFTPTWPYNLLKPTKKNPFLTELPSQLMPIPSFCWVMFICLDQCKGCVDDLNSLCCWYFLL